MPTQPRKKPAGAIAGKRQTESKISRLGNLPRRETTGGTFPIVGIGASAGGLEAIGAFLSHVPAETSMAFVIVQHLDPNYKGIMAELVGRVTSMKVMQVRDHQKVQPNCVYVIPPNKDMAIMHGVLHLFEPAAPRGLRLPIDYFFRSLAEDRHHLSIGVILSGMGSDGTMGLRAIKDHSGIVLVQEPSSAKFDAMPRSAIDAGLADFVAPPEELPERIIHYLKHAPHLTQEPSLEGTTQSNLEKVLLLIKAQTGQDFSMYKKSTIYRRIERRMGIHKIDKIVLYLKYVRENPAELDILFKELLIGVTNFFRDPAAWEILKTKVIQPLLSKWPPGKTLRAWTPGCSTGEEAYSLAILLKETMEQLKFTGSIQVQIFATDLDHAAIDKARQGIFPVNITADVSAGRLKRFFVKDEKGYRVNKHIREMVTFAAQNVITDPPFTKLDILICRNLLIYLVPEIQKKLMPLFHYSLVAGGVLFLGSAETVGPFLQLFAPIDDKVRIFRRTDAVLIPGTVEFPSSFTAIPGIVEHKPVRTETNLQAFAEQFLLKNYSPPAVLINKDGDIMYISGRTGKYLELPAGKANWNIFAMAREGLRYELSAAVKKAARQKEAVVVRGLKVGMNGGEQYMDLIVKTIEEPEELAGIVAIIFKDLPTPHEVKASQARISKTHHQKVEDLETELQQAREELRTTKEEMQTSMEELKSTNEELQSSNEELQSTNEELSTSKEELQSMNEELQTVNSEQQTKCEELSRVHSDMKNLLNNTEIAIVFLDNELNVRRFTTQASRIIKLLPGDIGRPVTDLSTSVIYPELAEDAHDVLRTLAFKEKQVTSTDDRWFTARIMPYRTIDNRLDGLVITFSDITELKKLEGELRKVQTELQKRFNAQTVKLELTEETLRNKIRGEKSAAVAGKVRSSNKPK